LSITESSLAGMNILVMGLGLHGGGTATARFLSSRGARVTVTDLRSPEVLAPSLEALKDRHIDYILGEHRMEDFSRADLVIKNPAVPPDNLFLKAARRVETDISLFLRLNRRPVLAVTGSKGKSTTTSALHHILKARYPRTVLGGNITVSPLTFLDGCSAEEWNRHDDPVVLELSSWQLADMRGLGVLTPRICAVTNILKDHQDRYGGMEAYVADKKEIFRHQGPGQFTLCFRDDSYGPGFAAETPGKALYFSAGPLPDGMDGAFLSEPAGGGLRLEGKWEELLPEYLPLPGKHNRLNCLVAAAMARLYGQDPGSIRAALAEFHGIGHRLELVRIWEGIRFYNDSAATIPDAVAAALGSFAVPVVLITGGTDKNLDFAPLRPALSRPSAVCLLEGTALPKFRKELQNQDIPFQGPFDSLKAAFDQAVKTARGLRDQTGQEPVVLLSPGCASFGMFLNEFDRGRQFVDLVKGL